MNNFKISTSLYAGFIALILTVLSVSLFSLYQVRAANQALKAMYDGRVVALKQLKGASDMLTGKVLDTMVKSATGLSAPLSSLKVLDDAIATFKQQWNAYSTTHVTGEEGQRVETINGHLRAFDPVIAQLRQALESGDLSSIAALIRPVYAATEPVWLELDQLTDLQLRESEILYQRENAQYSVTTSVFVVVMVLSLVGGMGIAWKLTRSVTVPLKQALELSRSVASGDLTLHIGDSGTNEMAQLLTALHNMQTSLAQVVSSVRRGSDVVLAASSEIAQGNHELSARTENQAKALGDAAASMEKINATVKHNADSAGLANQLALDASSVAMQGGRDVALMVETMKGIHESSSKIADIITVIDGIAFQTNILALNAAVEAARAGEQGRGFAVVASEVRSLASRSAKAAREIKDLISVSVERVEHGAMLVGRAGSTMTEVVSSIRRVTNFMGEISTASHQQASDVELVDETINQIDGTTQQNAALVEEMAAAASSLKAQAFDLVKVVASFKLDANSPGKQGEMGQIQWQTDCPL